MLDEREVTLLDMNEKMAKLKRGFFVRKRLQSEF
jgi:hypothetical protein